MGRSAGVSTSSFLGGAAAAANNTDMKVENLMGHFLAVDMKLTGWVNSSDVAGTKVCLQAGNNRAD